VLQDYELGRETDAAKALVVAVESRIQRAVAEFPGVELVSMAFEQQQPELKVLHQQTLGLCHKVQQRWRAVIDWLIDACSLACSQSIVLAGDGATRRALSCHRRSGKLTV
jgi:hypothetical protein